MALETCALLSVFLCFQAPEESKPCTVLECLVTMFSMSPSSESWQIKYSIHLWPSQAVMCAVLLGSLQFRWDLLLTSPLTGQQVTRMMPWGAGLLSCCTVGYFCCEASWAGRLQKVLEASDRLCVKTSLSPYISLSDGFTNIEYSSNRG